MRTLSILILMCTAVVANAQLVAYDDFSSGDQSGGFGWATDWTEEDEAPLTMNFSTADPLSDGLSAGYYSEPGTLYPHRVLATPLQASTTPEFWAGIYLRPVTLPGGGWQFGLQIFDINEDGSNNYLVGGMCGLMYSENNLIQLANSYAGARVNDGTSQFTLDQETMLVMRFYKNSPTDTVYNRVDLYADLDGTDGRYNNEVAIATGYDLGTWATDEFSLLRINQSGFAVDWDYVAVGTTKESDIYPLP